jgi:hypothetical protein
MKRFIVVKTLVAFKFVLDGNKTVKTQSLLPRQKNILSSANERAA